MSEPINPALAFQPGDTVRHRIHSNHVMRVTSVDELRGRWVCCAFKNAPDAWQHERYAPDQLTLVARNQTAAEYLAACAETP